MLGIGLAILSAVVSGFAVVLVARRARDSNPLNISIIITATGLLASLPFALAFTDFSAFNIEAILLFAASGILAPGLTRLFYYHGLKKLGTSVNSSVFSFYPIYGVFLAALFLNEVLTIENLLGVAAIISGIIVIEMSCKNHSCADSSLRQWSVPIVGGITFAVSAVLSKMALSMFNAPMLGVAIAFAFALIPYGIWLFFSNNARNSFSLRKSLNLFWLAGVGLAGAGILSFWALSFDSVSIVIPLRSTESLFVVFFAFFYLKQQEQLSISLITGIIITVIGVLLVII
jgi:drug/metabolite transporter, DME family